MKGAVTDSTCLYLCLLPGDGNETAGAYKAAILNAKAENPLHKKRPTVLALSRQGMPNLPGSSIEGTVKGGYIVHGGSGKPDIILIGTGTVSVLCLRMKRYFSFLNVPRAYVLIVLFKNISPGGE